MVHAASLRLSHVKFRPWLPIALGLAVMYIPTYLDLAHGLWRDEAYAHGPIILAVVFWLLWRQRDVLTGVGADGAAPLAGGAVLALGLAFYIIGRSQNIALFEVGSHIPVMAGTVLMLRGYRVLLKLWFPFFFLLFLVPLPGFVIEATTGPLKNLVSHAVETVLYEFGYPVARSGVVLSIGRQYQLLVADACSGLNSIYSLTALGSLYLYLTASNPLRIAVLAASIVPIALVANIVRVSILVLITFYLGDAAGQSFLHGFAGFLLFAIAVSLLFGLDALLRRIAVLSERKPQP